MNSSKHRRSITSNVSNAIKKEVKSGTIRFAADAAKNYVTPALHPLVDVAEEYLLADPTPNTTPAMGRRRGKKQRTQRRRRRGNGYLRPTLLHIKDTILWSDTSGTSGKWYYNITLLTLIQPFVSVYDEFRILSLTVRYLPNNSTSAEGLYAFVLMDQSGFGAYGSASEIAWFKTLASMPGSRVNQRHEPASLRWYPTEPASREWRSYERDSLKSVIVATLYIADNGKETTELGGVFEMVGRAQGRGRYYNAKTLSLRASVAHVVRSANSTVPEDLEMSIVSLDDPADD